MILFLRNNINKPALDLTLASWKFWLWIFFFISETEFDFTFSNLSLKAYLKREFLINSNKKKIFIGQINKLE